MATDRTTLRLTDERKRKLDRAAGVISEDPHDDPPRSDVIDAALQHLIESKQNIEDARDDPSIPAEHIQEVANTSAVKLHYRTSIDSPWR